MFRIKFLVFGALVLGLFSACQGGNSPQFLVVNLADQEYDLRLEIEKKPIFEKLNLPGDQAIGFLPGVQTGLASLKFKASVAAEWVEWQNPESKPYPCQLESGQIYLLMVEPDGKAQFRKMNGLATSGPQIAFLNSTSRRFATVQVGRAVNENMQIYHQDLNPGMLTAFYPLKPGDYPIFWQLPGRMDPLEAEYLINETGEPLHFTFKPGHSYLFWISKPGASGKGAQLLDFTLLP